MIKSCANSLTLWSIGRFTGDGVALALDQRAIYAFDDFMIARLHMFLMVYFHHKSVVYEEMLKKQQVDIFAGIIDRYVLLSEDGTFNVLVDLRDGSAHSLPSTALSVMADPRPGRSAERPANRPPYGPQP